MPQENLSNKYFGNFKIFYKKTAIITLLLAILYGIYSLFFRPPYVLFYDKMPANFNNESPIIETNKNIYLPGEQILIKVKIGKKVGISSGALLDIDSVKGDEVYFADGPQWSLPAGGIILGCRELQSSTVSGEWGQFESYNKSIYPIQPGEYMLSFAYSNSTRNAECISSDQGFSCPRGVGQCDGDEIIASKTIKIINLGVFSSLIAWLIYFLTKSIPFAILYIILVIILNFYNASKKKQDIFKLNKQ